ncbi:uncharacterized protein LOC142350297 [Convolutriloba macropyga]|uniref:uncharacterized protein LOC142350297 n=1 Tax=Convolutriloba macropyga TaxID=536237 RepID=UPI003F527691
MGNCSSDGGAINGVKSPRHIISEKESVEKRDQFPFFKLIIVGDSNCGKSTVVNAICGRGFGTGTKPTKQPITSTFEQKLVNDAMKIGVSITEIPQHTPMKLKEFHYRDLDGAIIVVDLSDQSSVTLSNTWKRDILTKATQSLLTSGIKSHSTPTHPPVQKPRSKGRKGKPEKSDRGEDSHDAMDDVIASVLTSSDEESSSSDLSDTEQRVSGVDDKSDFPVVLIGTKLDLTRLSDDPDELNLTAQKFRSSATKQGFTDCVAISRQNESSHQQFASCMDQFFQSLIQKRAANLLKNNLRVEGESSKGFPTQPPKINKPPSNNRIASPDESSALNLTSSTLEFSTPRSTRTAEDGKESGDFLQSESFLATIVTPRNRPASVQHQFILTGLTDLDVYLLQTEPMLVRVADMRLRFEKQKVNFSETCFECGVVKSQGTSVLQCVTSIRDQTVVQAQMSLKDRGSSGGLEIQLSSSAEQKYKNLIDMLNSQVLKVCRDIEREFPMISHAFINADDKLNKESKNAWNLGILGAKTSEEIHDLQSTIEKNQSLLMSSQETARETLSDVRDLVQNITRLFSDETPR